VAGSAIPGYRDGDTTQVQFLDAQPIVTDNNGNLFVGDFGSGAIRQVTYAGHVTTYAGNGMGSPNPTFGFVRGLTRDSQGNFYTVEYNLIRKVVSPANSVILAGSLTTNNYFNGIGTNAAFNQISNMVMDNQGNIFLPDYDRNNNLQIRKVTPGGVVSTLPLQDNTGITSNGIDSQCSIAIDASGNIYVSGYTNHLIKKIDVAGNVTIFAGSVSSGFLDGKGMNATFGSILGMTCDASGNVWVSDSGNCAVREVTPDGSVKTIAGRGIPGYADGDDTKALFNTLFGIAVDNNGVVYVVDNGNSRVRKLEYK
jgi:sugar lactone lactonase YvrE